jgi:Mg2+ and Co2+ transporter CorA
MSEIAWRFGYPVVIAGMLVLAGGLLWAFYRKGWFK